LTPDGKTLVYAAMHDKTVEFVDVATRKVTGKVALQGTPVSLTISPDGTQAFASAEEADNVYVINIAEKRIAREIKTAKGMGPDPVFAHP
jgi:YVTN family beta-propeller protein